VNPAATHAPSAAAEATLARQGRSFHWARRLLGATHAARATRLYAFCRHLDDLVDEAASAEAARAALLSYAEDGKGHVASYSIAGRSMTFRSTDDILKLITKLESDVAKENTIGAILAGGTPGRILTRNR
jgi:phytoene/squalene synthetase